MTIGDAIWRIFVTAIVAAAGGALLAVLFVGTAVTVDEMHLSSPAVWMGMSWREALFMAGLAGIISLETVRFCLGGRR